MTNKQRIGHRGVSAGGKKAKVFLTGLGVWLTGTAVVVVPSDVYAQSKEEAADLKPVVVSARRRQENAQDVPIPITSVDGNTLEQNGQVRLEQLNQLLPSTNVQFTNPRQTSIAVRGLGNNPANDALESSVGVYLDNVYLGRPSMANLDLIDIDQLTLLRGPQGTLFGKNTTAGVLNITTRKPSFSPQSVVEASGGSVGYYQFRGSTSAPLIEDKLAFRLSASKSHQDGYVKDAYDGRELNGYNRSGARGQLLWQPTETFNLRAIADYNEESSDCCVGVLYGVGPNDGATYWERVASSGATSIYDPDYRTSTINDRQHMSVHQGGGSVEANWQLGGYTLTSISAYRTWWFAPLNDGDGLDISAIISAGQRVDDRQVSQELRLASPADRSLQYVAGVYYFYQDQHNRLFTIYGPEAGAWLGAVFLNDGRTETAQFLKTNSASAFVQATWKPNEQWSVTAGLRDTVERKQVEIDREVPVGSATFQARNNEWHSGQLRLSDDNISALLSVDHKLAADVLVYASVSRGAKAGGINPSVPTGTTSTSGGLGVESLYIRPEKATDAELGFKTSWLNRKLILNGNLFWTDVEDYQATLLEQDASGTFQQVLSNIGKVRTRGVETELTAVPAKGTTLRLSASYNDAVYRSYKDAPCSAELLAVTPTNCVQDLSGQQVVGAPKWIVNPSIEYGHNLPGDLRGNAGAAYAWRSKFYGSADNSQYAEVASFGLLNLRYAVTGALGAGIWTASLWANNALDKHYLVGGLTAAPTLRAYTLYPGSPRIVGLTLRVEF